MTSVRQAAKWVLPFVVSGGFLIALLSRMELRSVLGHVTPRSGLILVPVVLLYGALSLWIEAISLVRMSPVSRSVLSLWTAARIKSASYLLYLVNYTLGAGSLTLLLRRRAGLGLGDAGGIVILIALFDLGLLMIVSSVGAVLPGADTPPLLTGVISAAGFGLLGGLAVLRFPRSLGPLDRLRSLAVFRAARNTPRALLIELGLLRLIFVIVFMAMAWASLWAFDIAVPMGILIVNFALVVLVTTLPIAVAGLGTGQAAFVYLFRNWGDPETLLACSLTLSVGLVLVRAGLGFTYSREFAREALRASREAKA